jgi:glycosyltransferase involved in cell wall biosynthesis
VLHPLLHASFPFIIHVREIYNGTNEKVKPNLKKAKGVIFIDESTRAPFRDIGLSQSVILNNPIDMTDVCARVHPDQALTALTAGKTVFSVIGGMDKNKGVDYIIEAFIQIASPKAVLLIVGTGHESFINSCKEIAGNDNRIIFFGEEPDIKKIYQVSDYILRGEGYFCIGRTIFEGLYAGCKVIVPGAPADADKFFEFHKFADSIFFYSPKSVSALKAVLEDQVGKKVENRICGSNLAQHVSHFNNFIQQVRL